MADKRKKQPQKTMVAYDDALKSLQLAHDTHFPTREVPFLTALRMFERESGCQPGTMCDMNVKSHRGAGGLMQLMPETRQYMQNQFKGLANTSLSPVDKEMQFGIGYLRELFDMCGKKGYSGQNQQHCAVASYNGGPTRYNDWFSGKQPYPDETRRYVNYVLTGTDHPDEKYAFKEP